MCPLSTGSLSLKTQMAENQGNIHCLVEAPRVPNTLHICDISYKSQVLLRILDGVPMTNPHHTDDSTARRDFGVHHKIPSAVWDHDTQEENRNTVKTVTAASRKHPWKLKTDREGEKKAIQIPLLQPHCSVHLHGVLSGNASGCCKGGHPLPLPPVHPEGRQRDNDC